jgi:undecaprenyl-diphosphatase
VSVAEAPPPAPVRAAETARRAVRVARKGAGRATVPRREALARALTGELVALAALCGFGALFAVVRAKRSAALDMAITLKVQERRFPWTGKVMSAVSWPGFPPQSRLIPPIAIATMFVMRMPTEAAFQLLAWGTGGLSTVVKAFVQRPRPLPEQVRVVLAPLGGSSFPSGHVLTYVGTYGFMAYVVYTTIRPPQVRWPLSLGLVGLVGLVGPSRIYQGHHWPTDVAASYFLGLTYLIGLMAVYRRVRSRLLAPGEALD